MSINAYFDYFVINLPDIIHYEGAGVSNSNFLNGLSFILIYYGTAIAVIIGFCSISIEKKSNTLNTLITKPLYRDTVINGKLIGCALFLCLVSLLASMMYLSEWMVLMGNIIDLPIYTFLFDTIVVLLVSWVCQLIFLSTSMFLSIIIKDDVLALFAGMFIYIFMINIISNASFALSLGNIFGSHWTGFIAGLGPDNLAYGIIKNSNDLIGNYPGYISNVVNLMAYLVISIVLSYIAFMRRDIA
jgi:ABC-2 type transport system permease protein